MSVADPPGLGAARFRRKVHSHQTQIGHGFERRQGVGARRLDFRGPGFQFLFRKVPGHLLDHFLFIGETKIHDGAPIILWSSHKKSLDRWFLL